MIETPNRVTQERLWIVAAILAAICLRFFMLSSHSLWIDEDLSLARVDSSSLSGVLDNLNSTPYDKYQPTYFIALYYWRLIFGESVSALRALSAVFGILSVIFIALAALAVYGRKHALWSTTLASFSAFHIYYSQEARAYTLVMFVSALALYFFVKAVSSSKASGLVNAACFWVVIAFGCVSSIFIFLLLLAICVSHLVSFRRKKAWVRFWMPFMVAILPAMSLYLTSPHLESLNIYFKTWYGTHVAQNFLFVVYGLLAGTTYSVPVEQLRGGQISATFEYWPHILLFLLALGAILLGLATKAFKTIFFKEEQSSNRQDAFFLTLIFVSLALSACFTLITRINWVPRHSAFVFPAIAILMPSAFCYESSREAWYALVKRLSLIGTVLLIAINVYSINNYFFSSEHARDDYRSAAEYLTGQNDSDKRSVLLWGSVGLLRHYGENRTIEIPVNRIAPEELLHTIQIVTDNADEIIVAVNREYLLNYPAKPILEQQYDLTSEKSFPHFNIYEYRRK